MANSTERGKTSHNMTEINSMSEFEAAEALKAVKAGHADDVDIAAQILADHLGSGTAESWIPSEDKNLIRKVDWRLIPIVRQRHYCIKNKMANKFTAFCLRHSLRSRQDSHFSSRNLQLENGSKFIGFTVLMGWICTLFRRSDFHGSLSLLSTKVQPIPTSQKSFAFLKNSR